MIKDIKPVFFANVKRVESLKSTLSKEVLTGKDNPAPLLGDLSTKSTVSEIVAAINATKSKKIVKVDPRVQKIADSFWQRCTSGMKKFPDEDKVLAAIKDGTLDPKKFGGKIQKIIKIKNPSNPDISKVLKIDIAIAKDKKGNKSINIKFVYTDKYKGIPSRTTRSSYSFPAK